MRYLSIILLSAILFTACGDNSGTGLQKNDKGEQVYYDKELDWQVETIDGWYVLDEGELERKVYAAEQTYDYDKNSKSTKRMVFGMQREKGKTNSLFVFSTTGLKDHRASLQGIQDQQYARYTAPFQGYDDYTLDTTMTDEVIAGIPFVRAYMKVTTPVVNGKQRYTENFTYSCMLGDTLTFGASINVNNDADRDRLIALWKASVATLND